MTDITLFPGEELNFSTTADPTGFPLSAEEIEAKYVAGDVRIVTEQARYPLVAVPGMLASGSYLLRPDFQRRHRWGYEKKSKLIESLIMNVPIPPIFLYEDSYSHYEVMDGLQRLTTIDSFYKNQFSLVGLEEWPELNDRTYDELPSKIRSGIDRRYLSSVILLQETAKSPEEAARMKQMVFERLNSGGIKLEPQESRNAIYPGPLNDLCIKLARNQYLCRMWGIPEEILDDASENAPDVPPELLENEAYRKMEDVELVLRFFAYRQRLKFQRGSLTSYFDRFLKLGNSLPAPVLESYEQLFNRTSKLVYEVLGERAFWLLRRRATGWSWFSRPTTVLFDPIMFAFSQYLDHEQLLVSKRKEIQAALPAFYQVNYLSLEGRYTNLSNIAERNSLFERFVKQFVIE